MSTHKRWILVLMCLLGAISCYIYGLPQGSVVFLGLGMLFEATFWVGVSRRRRKNTK
ncbi:hypothetical protein AUP74_00395 [Microbulbifer aggregans]|uniref:Lipoprotein n=1 Tax=Microbulbifer aggregans TaxID=1769779 RepID=A0A1C9W3Y7_9GAMM|nr:hypothetical protein [Microbulbifer aggregans]AOS95866.1 hypothetical protein AUP74_00395 [Microbulbifer aggregans]